VAGLQLAWFGAVSRGQSSARHAEHGKVARRIAPDQARHVLAAIRGCNREVSVPLEDVRGGDNLVTAPGESTGRHSSAAIDRDDRTGGVLDGVSQIVREVGEDASTADLV
jgi:hypothetical protein